MRKINSLKEKPGTWKDAISMLQVENPGTDIGALASHANRNYPDLRRAALGEDKAAEIMRRRMVDLSVNLAAFAKKKGITMQESVDLYVASQVQA